MLKKFCQCLGFASLILVVNYGELLGGGSSVRMHVPLRLTAICLAQIADIVLLAVALFVVLAPLTRTRLYPWVRLVLAIVVPPYLMLRTRSLFPFEVVDGLVRIVAVCWAAVLLLFRLRAPRWYRKTMQIASGVAAAFVLFAVSVGLQLAYVATWRPGPQERVATWSKGPQPVREHPLLMWVIFDELSYDQVFEHRARDLELPNFDALKAESTVYSDVQPAGYYTVRIVPSLLSGRTVDQYRFGYGNELKVHTAEGWQGLKGADTVFGDAQRAGWRTAVVGWYNPYCAVYGDALDSCYFANWDKIEGPMAQRATWWKNTVTPLEQLAREVRSPAKADRDLCSFDVHQRYLTHVDLEQHMVQLLKGDQADLVFLHVAVPHSPNIWSRIEDGYTQKCDSSYLDSLALADRELGRVMGILKSSPRWKDTTLIVEGDHSWRVDAWNWLPAWTDEDDAASRGEFDPRPALLVHRAGQTQGEVVKQAWPLIGIHGVVESVLGGSGR